jgi:transposase-like protein
LLEHLSRELEINPKTAARWRKRATDENLKACPKRQSSRVLIEA